MPTAVIASYAKVTGEAVRASAALAAAGAYDTAGASFVIKVADRDVASIWCTYTRGAANGSAKIKILGSCDNATTYAPMMIVAATRTHGFCGPDIVAGR